MAPRLLSQAIEGLGLPSDAVIEPLAGGASGSGWKVRAGEDVCVLRVSSSAELVEGRLAAMAAARAAGLPAPEVIKRGSTPDVYAVLLSWLPGRTMYEALLREPTEAGRWGRQMGELQRRLHQVEAPREVVAVTADAVAPFDAGRAVASLPVGSALLHLDWHPLNLLIDEEGGISGIVDWDNARSGHPLLDLARTHSLLTLDPSLHSLPDHVRPWVGEFAAGWADGYGDAASAIPPPCHAWAGRVMLADLAPRYAENRRALDHLRRWTDDWSRRSRERAELPARRPSDRR